MKYSSLLTMAFFSSFIIIIIIIIFVVLKTRVTNLKLRMCCFSITFNVHEVRMGMGMRSLRKIDAFHFAQLFMIWFPFFNLIS